MPTSHKIHTCALCPRPVTGGGKYCGPECRTEAKRRRDAEYVRNRRAGVTGKPGAYGEREAVLRQAYREATAERRGQMCKWHGDVKFSEER